MIVCDDCKKTTYSPTHYVLGAVRCPECSVIFNSSHRENKKVAEAKARAAHRCDGSTNDNCAECCEHNEFEHETCLDCGYERDPGEAIDRAMDAMEDR